MHFIFLHHFLETPQNIVKTKAKAMAQSTFIWVALALLLVSLTLGNTYVPFIVAHKNLKGTNHNTTT